MNVRGIKNFCKENRIELLVIFGSSAKNMSKDAHDTDIAVKVRGGMKISKLQLIYRLDEFFGGKNIDLVALTSDTDPLLLHEIFSNGKCIYERKKGIFEKEKLRAWKLYIDTEKIRLLRSSYLRNFVKKRIHVA